MRELPTNDLIREVFGENHPIPLGWQVLVQTYTIGDKFLIGDEESIFERPDDSKHSDSYINCIGRVLMIGEGCFKGPHFEHYGSQPEVGDYVSFRKYQGTQRVAKSPDGKVLHFQFFKEHELISIEPDPTLGVRHQLAGN